MDNMNVTHERWTVDRTSGLDGDGPRIDIRIAYCDGCDVRGVVCSTPTGEIEHDGGLTDMSGSIGTDPRGLVVLCAGREDGTDMHLTLCEECGATISIGDRVEGGRGEDHDTGVVLEVDGPMVTVQWDSYQTTTGPRDGLRLVTKEEA